MLDRPTADEILEAVARFLRAELLPQTNGSQGYKLRVAANAIELVRREYLLRDTVTSAAVNRLSALLRHEGSYDELNERLCGEIQRGNIGLETPGLREHLMQTAIDKLRIEQPGYEPLARAMRNRGAGKPKQ